MLLKYRLTAGLLMTSYTVNAFDDFLEETVEFVGLYELVELGTIVFKVKVEQA